MFKLTLRTTTVVLLYVYVADPWWFVLTTAYLLEYTYNAWRNPK